MSVVQTKLKDAFVLRVPINGDKVSSVVVFKGDGSRKFPAKLMAQYIERHGDEILSVFPENTTIRYGDLGLLLSRFARYQPTTAIERGGNVTIVTTGTLRTVVDTENFRLLD